MKDEILSQLRDIHMPEAPSLWPLAVGYYVVLLLLFLLISLGLYYFLGRHKRRLRKEVARELLLIERDYAEDPDVARLQASIAALLRRLVIHKNPNSSMRSAELSTVADRVVLVLPNKTKAMTLLGLLEKDRFQKSPQVDGLVLLNLAREQIKRCRI